MGLAEELTRTKGSTGGAKETKDDNSPPASPPFNPLLSGQPATDYDNDVDDACDAAEDAMSESYYSGLTVTDHYIIPVGDWAIDHMTTWAGEAKDKHDNDTDKQGQYNRLNGVKGHRSVAKNQVTGNG